MKTSNISQFKLVGLASVFAFASVAVPLLSVSGVSAAAIPKNQKFADEKDCVAKVSKHTPQEVDTYLKGRYDSRTATLKAQDAKIDQYYAQHEKRVVNAEGKYKKNHKKSSGIDASYLKTNKEYLHKVVSDTRSQLNGLSTTGLNAQKTSQGKAEAVCKMMYQLRVNTYVTGLVAWMRQVDHNRSSQTVNKIRKADTLAVYEARKSRYTDQTAATALVARLPDTNKFDKQFEDITAGVKKITPDQINAANPPKAFDQYKAFAPGALQLFAERSSQTKEISDIRKDLAKQKLKPKTTKKKSTTKKSNSGQSNGTGGAEYGPTVVAPAQ